MKIDSHHHFWKYSPQEYGWINDEMKSIRRNFLPDDLEMEIKCAGIDGVISVQARQTLDETKWLLGLSEENIFIYAVVGWVPLSSPSLRECLSTFSSFSKLKSVRHVLQGEPDDDFMLRKDFNGGIKTLKEFGLAYDILILGEQLPQTIKFVDMHPDQTFILDHIAKPRIRDNLIKPWADNIGALAKRQNVYCKVSGMVTEADFGQWTEEQLRPYFDAVLDAFGPERLIFGSDWPVCTLACEYRRWVGIVEKFISELSASEQDAIFAGNAVRAYSLKNETETSNIEHRTSNIEHRTSNVER